MSSFYGNAGGSGSGGGTADVPVATALRLGKVRPDNETITIDPDGTIHSKGGESSYKEGYLKNGKFYKKANFTGEYQVKSGTLYLDLPTLTQYICVDGTLVPLKNKVFTGTTEEWEALSEEEKAKYEINITNILNELDNKVDRVEGKDFSTNDFTDAYKSKLDNLSNYDDTSLNERLTEVEDIIPSNASSSNKLATMNDIPEVSGGTTDYSELDNKPQIAGIELTGNKALSELGIQPAEDGKGLSTNDFSDEDKSKLDNLSNYDDSSLKERLSNVENQIPSNVSSSNRLATMADIPSVPEIPEPITDYSELDNRPQIGGVTLDGNKSLADLGIQATEEGKGLSTEDYTTEEKNKLAGLSNYDDSALTGKIADIEGLIPSTASEENRLATIEDIPEISEVNAALDNKVDKVDGKGLSTEDYTTEEKEKLAGLSNYDDSVLAGRVSELEGVIPGSASAENKLATMADISNSGGSGPGGGGGSTEPLMTEVGRATWTNDSRTVTLQLHDLNWEIGGWENGWLSGRMCVAIYADIFYQKPPYYASVALPYTIFDAGDVFWYEVQEATGQQDNRVIVLSFADKSITFKTPHPTNSTFYVTFPALTETVGGIDLSTATNFTAVFYMLADDATTAGGGSYTLPLATANTLGGVKIGEGINISDDGTISVSGSGGGSADLDNKVDKIEGKGLSTNDFTTEEKNKLAELSNYDDTALDNRVSDVENGLSNKVDKDGTKGLSSNDFTNEDKAKLDGLSNYDDSTLVGLIGDLENDLSNKVDKDGDKVLSTNDFTNTYKDKLDNLSNYDDTALNERIADIENIIPNNVSAENKLVTMSDIGETSIITPQDIDRLWEMELEDGDKEGY